MLRTDQAPTEHHLRRHEVSDCKCLSFRHLTAALIVPACRKSSRECNLQPGARGGAAIVGASLSIGHTLSTKDSTVSAPDHNYAFDYRYEDDDTRDFAQQERRPMAKSHRPRRPSSRSCAKSASFNGIHRRRNKRWAW